MAYQRILLKISGEALGGSGGSGLDKEAITTIARESIQAVESGVQTAIVVGGGNFLRGAQITGTGIDRNTGDQMGMLATVINGLALRGVIESLGGKSTVFSAKQIQSGIALFDSRECIARLDEGHVVILTGGTGNPFFTTDSAAALRASELSADLFLKATKVDGVYDDDPVKNPDARMFDKLSYMDVIKQQLGVMDITAITLCMENKIPVIVCNMMREGNISRVLNGESVGTIIS